MDPTRRDILTASAARMHDLAHGDEPDRVTAKRYGISRRTANHHRHAGPPPIRDAQTYLWECGNPWLMAEELAVTAKQRTISEWSDERLIEEYRDALAHECEVEGDDRRCDVERRPWLDRSTASTRDAAVERFKAACEREFASRRISTEAVDR